MHAEVAAEHFAGELVGEVQAEAAATLTAAGGEERIEHLLDILWRDADTVVGDFDAQPAHFVGRPGAQFERAGMFTEGVGEGVVDQVLQDLTERAGEAVEFDAGGDLVEQARALVFQPWLQRAGCR